MSSFETEQLELPPLNGLQASPAMGRRRLREPQRDERADGAQAANHQDSKRRIRREGC